MRILISGANGFIGSALLSKLGNHTVYTLKHSTIFSFSNYNINLDLTNATHVNKLINKIGTEPFDVFFHFAAIPYTAAKSTVSYQKDFVMAKQIAKICKSVPISRFIFSSGWIVYSPKAKTPIAETAKLLPNTKYGQTKLKLERFFINKLKNTQIIILRISSVYGPGQETFGLIPTLVKTALTNQQMKLTSREVKRDYIFIDDLTQIIKKLIMEKTINYLFINIGSGRSVNIHKVASTIQNLFFKNYKIKVSITQLASSNDISPIDNQLDISRIKKIVTLNKSTSLEKGLLSYIKWHKNRN